MMNAKIQELHDCCLPREIIEDIIFRLPVKSLLKFKCVSKSWSSFISSKEFSKTHLQNQKLNLHVADQSIVSASRNIPSSYIYTLNHSSVDDLFCQKPTNDIPQFEFYRSDDNSNNPLLVGCCNGLCCFYIPAQLVFVLSNPSTGVSRQLLPNRYGRPLACGFGFVESEDDYKVFAIAYNFNDQRDTNRDSHIYSLKTNSWKTNTKRLYALYTVYSTKGDLANGKLHWSNYNRSEITCFDLEKECLGIVSQPPSYGGRERAIVKVFALEGCLGAIEYDKHDLTRDGVVWIMKKYGVEDSWCKLFTVPHYSLETMLYPLCMSLDGTEVLCRSINDEYYFEDVCIYNLKTRSSRSLGPNYTDQLQDCVGLYRRSLISPFHYGGLEDQASNIEASPFNYNNALFLMHFSLD